MITKKINWMTGTGKQATVTVVLTTEREINCDGDKSTVACSDMSIAGEVEGMGTVGYGVSESVPANYAAQGVVAVCGKLCIKAAEYAQVKAAIAEIEATPEWQAKIARQDAGRKAEAEYNRHRAMMRKAMSY
jgi:hypothetical protein